MLTFIISIGTVIVFIWLIINRVNQTDKEKFDNEFLKELKQGKYNSKKSESKREFNKISQSFDLIGKPTKLTRPGYAGGGKNRRR